MSSGVCGGERVAAQLEQDGFKTGKAFPCVYVNEQRQVLTIVHGDDHLRTGPVESLRWLEEKPKGEFEVKTNILGKHRELEKGALVLNRVLRITDSSWEFAADQKRVEKVLEELDLQHCKGLAVPGVVEPFEDYAQPLSEEQASRYM